jgi:ribonuclease HI
MKGRSVDKLWRALDAATHSRHIHWHWGRVHTGSRDHERVDRLVKQAIRSDQI